MSVAEHYLKLLHTIHDTAIKYGRNPSDISLIAVTKGHPLEHVMPAYHAGCRDFGENRVQEALSKIPNAPKDLRWHLIGTLQKNKVCKVIGKFVLIHSVDTLELAQKISKCSQEQQIITPILLQTNTTGETTKHGLTPEQWKHVFENMLALPNINIQGLMTMASFVDDEKVTRKCFSRLRMLQDELQGLAGERAHLKDLSMGMTHDYPQAIAEGATLLRIGTAIFGERQ